MTNDAVEPDTKDWTWVLEQPCPDCGYDAAALDLSGVPAWIEADAQDWRALLAGADVATRPDPATWSPLEYACHVRDVHRVFRGRVRQMLGEDDPLFENWDQDATALESGYADADPAEVARELVLAAVEMAATYAAVGPLGTDVWQRPGRRSNGSVFTVDTLARYHLHDLVHHRWDVGLPPVETSSWPVEPVETSSRPVEPVETPGSP